MGKGQVACGLSKKPTLGSVRPRRLYGPEDCPAQKTVRPGRPCGREDSAWAGLPNRARLGYCPYQSMIRNRVKTSLGFADLTHQPMQRTPEVHRISVGIKRGWLAEGTRLWATTRVAPTGDRTAKVEELVRVLGFFGGRRGDRRRWPRCRRRSPGRGPVSGCRERPARLPR